MSEFSKYIVQAILRLIKGMGVMVNSLYKKALSAILRSSLGVMLVMVFLSLIPRHVQVILEITYLINSLGLGQIIIIQMQSQMILSRDLVLAL